MSMTAYKIADFINIHYVNFVSTLIRHIETLMFSVFTMQFLEDRENINHIILFINVLWYYSVLYIV